MTRIGIIGCGYWGPNLIRNFSELKGCEVAAVSDIDPKKLDAIGAKYPAVKRHADYREILRDKGVEGVVIATNLMTHFNIASDALEAGKHILLEKPVTPTIKEAEELVETAGQAGLIFMSGHTFLYNQGVTEARKYVDKGEIGGLLYLHAERTNLGPIRNDANAMWDLAPHDISIFMHITGLMPEAVAAHGGCFIKKGREDVVFITLRFPGGIIGNIHVSWLDPCKVRRVTLIGNRKMLLFDDLNTLEPIRIYDKGVEPAKDYGTFGEFRQILRDGDILIPKVRLAEPLKNECSAFVDAITSRKPPLSDGILGMNVVKVLCAAQESLDGNGRMTEVRQ